MTGLQQETRKVSNSMAEWYILREQEHLGPFTHQELEKLARAKRIGPGTRLWKRSLSLPITLSEYRQHFSEGVQVPPLPGTAPRPTLGVAKEAPVAHTWTMPSRPVFTPSPVHHWSAVQLGRLKTVGMVLAVLVVVTASFSLQQTFFSSGFTRPKNMPLKTYDNLSAMAAKGFAPAQFALSFAKDFRQLWMATNLIGAGQAHLVLESEEGKILGAEKVSIKAQGDLQDKLISFDHFEFGKGDRLYPGYYRYHVTLHRTSGEGLWTKVFVPEESVEVKGRTFVSRMPQAQFDRQLKERNQKLRQKSLLVWQELSEKTQTLKAVGEQIQMELAHVMNTEDKRQWNAKLRAFKAKYQRNYGHFFTTFVVENDQRHRAPEAASGLTPARQGFRQLSSLAEGFGQASMDIYEGLENFRQQPHGDVLRFYQQKLQTSFTELFGKCEAQLAQYQKQMSQMSRAN